MKRHKRHTQLGRVAIVIADYSADVRLVLNVGPQHLSPQPMRHGGEVTQVIAAKRTHPPSRPAVVLGRLDL